MKENRCFFRFLEIGTISFELGEIGERCAKKNRKKVFPVEKSLILLREVNALANPSDLSPNKPYFG